MTTKPSVIYLLKDKFQFYSPALAQLTEFRFTPDIIRDLDVVSTEMLENMIKTFVTNTKAPPSDLYIVLSENTYFTKDFVQQQPKPDPQKPNNTSDVSKELLQKQADQFVEHVPYDNVVSKSFKLANGIKVIAANKEFFESIAVGFEHQGFAIATVLPGLVFGGEFSTKPALDPGMVSTILQKSNSFKEYDLLGQAVYTPIAEKPAEEEKDEVEVEKGKSEKPDKKRLFALVGVFASLLVVLVLVFVQSQNPPSPPQQPAQADNTQQQPINTAPAQTNPEPTAVPQSTSTVGDQDPQTSTVSIMIISPSSASSTAQSLREALLPLQFQSVSTQTQNSVNATATQITFTPQVNQAARNMILTEVRRFASNINVQEQPQNTVDVTVVLAQ